MFQILNTTDLTSSIYKDALLIRKTVFIEEQHVPEEIEIAQEDQCIHCVCYDHNQTALGTVRLIPYDAHTLKVQRMAVYAEYRSQGVGRALMEYIEQLTKETDYSYLKLGAQRHALPFYESLGYKTDSDCYIEAGIEHQDMKKSIN